MSSPDTSILEYLSFRLDRLCEMSKRTASTLYEREFGVSVRDLRVLRFSALEPGLTLTRLIDLTLLEKTVASKLVTSLSRQGLLRRQVGEHDARQINLFLTPAGEALVARTYERGNVMETMFLSVLSESELRSLNRSIDKLTTALEAYQSHMQADVG